uniref:Uncharacterized protein n=1 Tax=Talaromyces marneffei PM1 TaxID=1077442 RepID=A0A093VEK7_TALMA
MPAATQLARTSQSPHWQWPAYYAQVDWPVTIGNEMLGAPPMASRREYNWVALPAIQANEHSKRKRESEKAPMLRWAEAQLHYTDHIQITPIDNTYRSRAETRKCSNSVFDFRIILQARITSTRTLVHHLF